MGIETIIGMIPRGGKFAKSVVNFVHKANQNWPKLKTAIQQIDDLLKQGKLRLDGKQKTIFESNKNILKNHEKVQKSVFKNPPYKSKEFPPFNVSKEDYTKGWKPTLVERIGARKKESSDALRKFSKEWEAVQKESKKSPYTKKMEVIDEELDELLSYQKGKYQYLHSSQKEALYEKLQADMKKLLDATKKEDLTTLSLSQLNKKSQDLQKRIREIADNPNIKGTVSEGPKKDMIAAIYDSENAALTKARYALTRKNSELKYGKKYPVLDPENDTFIVLGLDEFGHPNKISRFTGKFSATKDKTTGELTSSDGTSFWDTWDPKKNQMRKKGEEVFHETLNREGKVIMSNPEYKLPVTERMDLHTELYTNLSTSDLAKKGFSLKQIDMIVKGRKVREYLDKTKSKDTYISMHEQTSSNEIGAVLEDLYNRGDDVYKMSMKEWITKIPEYFAEGGQVPGFATGGISNLFRERQGFRTGNIAKLPEFLKFVEGLLIKASNEIRQGVGKWKGLTTSQKVTQHDNLTKLATEFQKTKKFDVRINEYTGIDAEKAFIEAQAKVKAKEPLGKIWKSSEGETQGIAMGYSEAELKGLDQAMAKGTALSDAMKALNLNPASSKDYFKFEKLVSEGMIGFSRELKEQIIRAKYGHVVNKELLNQMLTDSNPQRLSEVMGTIDEGVIMKDKGMGTDEIINTLKESFKRKPNVEGGLIPGYATGGVSNLFRSR